MQKKIHALGIMNGTSLDAIDYSLIEVSSDLKKIAFKKHIQKKLTPQLRKALIQAAHNQTTTYDLSRLHFQLGELYAKHIKSLSSKWRFQIIGLHGQTLHHQGGVASLQIGHPAAIYREVQKPIYYDFRSADLAVGGQGAPFAPLFQKWLLAGQSNTACAFHNLGGISNLCFVHKNKVIATDTGPANVLLDLWVQKKLNKNFDKDGRLAAQGLPDPEIVNQFLKHPYFTKKLPKSTGREEFHLDFIAQWGGSLFNKLSLNDQLATLTELTARSIFLSYQSLKISPKRIYFYGGGVYNKQLMKRLQFYFHQTEFKTTDELGWPSQAFEASLFAFLAAARHFNKTVHLPKLTGAKKTMPLGSVYG